MVRRKKRPSTPLDISSFNEHDEPPGKEVEAAFGREVARQILARARTVMASWQDLDGMLANYEEPETPSSITLCAEWCRPILGESAPWRRFLPPSSFWKPSSA